MSKETIGITYGKRFLPLGSGELPVCGAVLRRNGKFSEKRSNSLAFAASTSTCVVFDVIVKLLRVLRFTYQARPKHALYPGIMGFDLLLFTTKPLLLPAIAQSSSYSRGRQNLDLTI